MDSLKLILGKGMAALAVFVAVGALADDAAPVAPAAGTSVAPVAAPAKSDAKIVGILDLRPSYLPASGEFRTENMIEGGYKFNKTVQVTYVQFFNTNLFAPKADERTGVSLSNEGGFIRTRLSKLLTSGDLTFSMQNRAYLPVRTVDRDRGMITAVRQYLTLNQKISKVVSLTAMEIPILHLYSKSGLGARANPSFENRVYLIGDIQLSDKLSLSVPVMFHVTKNRDHAGKAGATTFFAWINPELGYEVSDNLSVGVGYYSDNLVNGDGSGLSINEGLKAGVFQLVATMSL